MSSTHPASLGRSFCDGRKPMNTALLAGAVAVVIVAGILFAVSFAETFVVNGQQQEALARCAATTADTARLACYDVFARQALEQPAKGANAPVTR